MGEEDLDLEIGRIIFKYEADCPYCGDNNEFGEINPDGSIVDCEHCGEKFRASQ